MMELFFEISGSKYGEGVLLNEYKGEISLIAARKGREGTNHMAWCYPQMNKRATDKAIPWKIIIGKNHREAATMLQKILAELSG